jgi:glucokinase
MVHQFSRDPNPQHFSRGLRVLALPPVPLVANLSWSLSGERLERSLGIPRVTLINDFAAIGYGLAGLQDGQLATLQAGIPDPAAPLAIIGAGTGQAFIPNPMVPRAFPSEGGHTDFAPDQALNFSIDLSAGEEQSAEGFGGKGGIGDGYCVYLPVFQGHKPP